MSETLKVTHISGGTPDTATENPKMKKLLDLLENPTLGIDLIKYQFIYGRVDLVPYTSNPEKGHGSFLISKDDFSELKSKFTDITFTQINKEVNQDNFLQAVPTNPAHQDILTPRDKRQLTEIGVPIPQIRSLQEALKQLVLANSDTDPTHIAALEKAVKTAIAKYEEVINSGKE